MSDEAPIRILFVDDREEEREWWARWLRQTRHYEVETSGGSLESIEQLVPDLPSYDVAMIDVYLEGPDDGIALMRRIHVLSEDTEVVIITGRGGVESGIQALSEGAYGYARKPLNQEEVVVLVEAAAKRRRLKARLGQALRELASAKRLAEVDQELRKTFDLDEMLHTIARAVTERFGFRMVAMSTIDKDGGVRIRAVEGLDRESRDNLDGQVTPGDVYFEPMQDQFKISRSFLIRHDHYNWSNYKGIQYVPDLGDRAANEWHPEDTLRIPILSRHGDVLGILSVDDPIDRRIPTRDEIEVLEGLADHAAAAIDWSLELARQLSDAELALRDRLLRALKPITVGAGLEETVGAITASAREAIPGLDAITVWCVDGSDAMRLMCQDGVRNPAAIQQEGTASPAAPRLVMQAAEPIWAEDVDASAVLGGRFARDEQIASSAALPLRARGANVGAMFFNYRRRHAFTRSETSLFPLFAEFAAAAILQAKLLEDAQRARDAILAAVHINDAIGSTLNLDEMMEVSLRELRTRFPHAVPSIMLYDQSRRELEFAAVSADQYSIDVVGEENRTTVPLSQGIAGRTARKALTSGDPACEYAPSIHDDQDYLNLIQSTESELCVSLMAGKSLFGILDLESARPGAFSEHDIHLVKAIAGQLGLALSRARRSVELSDGVALAAIGAQAAELLHRQGSIASILLEVRAATYTALRKPDLDGTKAALRTVDELARRLSEQLGELVELSPAISVENPRTSLDKALGRWARRGVRDHSGSVELHLELHCPDIYVCIAEGEIGLVLMQFIRNALEAMNNEGSVTIRSGLRDGGVAVVQVEDSGRGVPEHLRSRLFRLGPVSPTGDTHLGLAIVRAVLGFRGGEPWLERTAEGGGTVFAFSVPTCNLPSAAERKQETA